VSGDIEDAGVASEGTDDYLTEDEGRKLTGNLHRVLCWREIKPPELLEVDRSQLDLELEEFRRTGRCLTPEIHVNHMGTIKISHLIWRLVGKKELPQHPGGQRNKG